MSPTDIPAADSPPPRVPGSPRISTSELRRELSELVAERDSARAEIERVNTELERRLAERTIERDSVAKDMALAELTRTNSAEEQLRLYAVRLESVNAELESFSYSVSHDLRAPVRAILGFVTAIEEECGSDLGIEGRRLLSVVAREASRMGELIDDLLEFSRIGRQPMSDGLVDMTALAREAAAADATSRDGVRCSIEIDDLPPVRGDRMLLRQAWVNLISNAMKYSGKEAAPHVRIWATNDESTTTYHIRDNGVGFDMRYADKLFGVFQRLHRATEFPGHGVGLAIVMRVVKKHGGSVRAEARVGEGATFSLTLPNGDAT
jgi:two-component system sensor histidine kinase/response regulator